MLARRLEVPGAWRWCNVAGEKAGGARSLEVLSSCRLDTTLLAIDQVEWHSWMVGDVAATGDRSED